MVVENLISVLTKGTVRRIEPNLVLAKYVNRKYEGEIKSGGNSVTVQTVGDITLADTTDVTGGDLPEGDFIITEEELLANISKGRSIPIKNIEKAWSNLDLQGQITDRLARAIAENLETHVASHYVDAHVDNQLDAGDFGGTAGNAFVVTEANVHKLASKIKAKATKAGVDHKQLKFFITPEVEEALVNAKWVNGSEGGYSDAEAGLCGKMSGIPLHVANFLPTVGSDVYLMAYIPSAINMADKLTELELRKAEKGFYSNLLFETTYGSRVFGENAKALFTVKIVNS